jgi:hypothetical protein
MRPGADEATQHAVENLGERPIHNLVLELKPGSTCSAAADPARTRAEITALLTDFLSPQQNPTRAAHERFWADELVYTSSAGKVTNKAEILKSFDEPPKVEVGKAPEPEPVYSAEDILVRSYGTMGDMAALTFRLVARAADGSVQSYRNSGTFLLRDGKWQAITGATKVPPAEPNESASNPSRSRRIAAAMVRCTRSQTVLAIPATERGAAGREVVARRPCPPSREVDLSARSRARRAEALARAAFRPRSGGLARLRRAARRLSPAPARHRRHRRTVRAVGAPAAGRPRGLAARVPPRRGHGARRDPGLERARPRCYRLPHPLLGKLTVREMLFFTVYHNAHHLDQVASRR